MVSFPELPGCITCGENIESAIVNAMDAKQAWLEAAVEGGIDIREPNDLDEYSGQFKLRIPRSLHRSLAEHSKREGISIVYIFCLKMMQCFQNNDCGSFHNYCNKMATFW